MSENKHYYYLKLKNNFFDQEEIRAIEGQQNGYEYICIIQKMYLRSLSREGKLMLTDTIPYDLPSLSAVLGHKQETVKMAIELFQKYGLCEILSDQTIYMTEIQNFIGLSSTEADRKRLYRVKIEEEKLLNGTFVHALSPICPDKYPPEYRVQSTDNKKEKDTPINSDEFSLKNQERDEKAEKDQTEKSVLKANRAAAKEESKISHGPMNNVRLTSKEYDSLVLAKGKETTEKAIEFFGYWIEEKGKKVKSHYAAIQRWVFDAVTKDKSKSGIRPLSKQEEYENTCGGQQQDELDEELMGHFRR